MFLGNFFVTLASFFRYSGNQKKNWINRIALQQLLSDQHTNHVLKWDVGKSFLCRAVAFSSEPSEEKTRFAMFLLENLLLYATVTGLTSIFFSSCGLHIKIHIGWTNWIKSNCFVDADTWPIFSPPNFSFRSLVVCFDRNRPKKIEQIKF